MRGGRGDEKGGGIGGKFALAKRASLQQRRTVRVGREVRGRILIYSK